MPSLNIDFGDEVKIEAEFEKRGDLIRTLRFLLAAIEIAGNPEDACKSLIAALKARKEAATHGK